MLSRAKPVATLNGNYLQDLRVMDASYPLKEAKIRLAPLFISDSELSQNTAEFAKLAKKAKVSENPGIVKRVEILGKADGSGNLVFEITNPSDSCLFESVEEKGETPVFVEVSAAPLPEDSNEKEGAITALSKAVAGAIAGKVEPVNLAIYPHVAITKALRHFLYSRKGKVGIEIPIAYSDGSEGRTFPTLALAQLPEASLAVLRKTPLTPIGEITGRHLDMDKLVTEYWFRNQLVSVSRPMAETDEIAYLYTKRKLEELRGKKIRIAFYQTGFPPVAIGFYRALVEELIKSRVEGAWIEVLPYFFDGREKDYEAGDSWV
jgi:hypothetical protein